MECLSPLGACDILLNKLKKNSCPHPPACNFAHFAGSKWHPVA